MSECQYVSTHPDNDIILKGVGPPVLNHDKLAKYYDGLAILDENKIRTRDSVSWDEFKI